MGYPKQWEFIKFYWDELGKAPYYGSFDHLGKEGWELAAIERTRDVCIYHFKRPLNYKPRKKL